MRIVTNSSPLIAFASLKQLDLLALIFTEIYIPQAVFDEITVWRKPYSQQLKTFAKDRVKPTPNPIAVQLLTKDIDRGEAEAIVLALENGIKDILIDDPKGRRIARVNGLYPIGTIGVLLEAKRLSHIDQIKPYLDELITHRIRIGKNLYQQALKLAGDFGEK
jgi:predicted nucleic acid-binding protein